MRRMGCAFEQRWTRYTDAVLFMDGLVALTRANIPYTDNDLRFLLSVN